MNLRRAPGVAAVILVAVLLTAGCTRDPGPAPAITDPAGTTVEPVEPVELESNPQLTADQAAIQAYKNYIAAYNQAGRDGYTNADSYYKLLWFAGTNDFAAKTSARADRRVAAGAHQTGELRLSRFSVVEHKDNSDIVLEVCQDTTDFDVVLPDGTSVLDPGTTGRFVATVEMIQAYAGDPTDVDLWRIGDSNTDRGRPC